MSLEYYRDDLVISTDKSKLQINIIHGFLQNMYWCKNIPIEVVKKSIEHSLVYGIYGKKDQIGFARVITDYATFAYLADVFVINQYRGKGLSKWLMECILDNPELKTLRTWMLKTKDAHGLYAQFGFIRTKTPERVMELKLIESY